MTHANPLATLAAMASVLVWSATALVLSYTKGISPFAVTAVMECVGAFVFLSVATLRGEFRALIKQTPLWYVLAGLIGIGLHGICWTVALQTAPPLEATLLIYMWPIMIVVLTTIALQEKLQKAHIAGTLLGFLGICVLFMGKGLDFSTFSFGRGHVIALVSAITWALFSALIARRPATPLLSLGFIFLANALLNIFLAWQTGGLKPFDSSILVLLLTIAVFGKISYGTWAYGMKHGNRQLIGVFSFLTPILAAAWLVLFGRDTLTPQLLIAFLLVMTGIACVRFGVKPKT